MVGDRIAAIGDLGQLPAAVEVDARGHVLSPGFIDTHTHDDRALLSDPLLASKVSQGVTTVVTGNCGISLAPLGDVRRLPPAIDVFDVDTSGFKHDFAEYLAQVNGEGSAVNAVCLVGHTTLRVSTLGAWDRPATAAERAAMRRGVEAAMKAGATGFSTCLSDPETISAPMEEVLELARPVAEAGGVYSTHLRDEADRVLDALEEAFAVGREGGVPVVVSHHKCVGPNNHGRSRETLAAFDAARAHQRVGLDVYPYTASSIYLDPVRARRASRTIIAWSRVRPEVAGRELSAVAEEMGLSLEKACERLSPGGAVYFTMDEQDVRRVLAYPHTMIGSDGTPHDAHPHPRLWGTFPRVLGHYVRDVGLFPLEEAVRRMTSLPARRFGLSDRGLLKVGAYADLTLFDPETVIDRATFEQPQRPADGISLVVVNGRIVWRDGTSTGTRPGRILSGTGPYPAHALASW